MSAFAAEDVQEVVPFALHHLHSLEILQNFDSSGIGIGNDTEADSDDKFLDSADKDMDVAAVDTTRMEQQQLQDCTDSNGFHPVCHLTQDPLQSELV